MSWLKISFAEKTKFGSFILKMDPGARSTPHTHIGYEEFLEKLLESVDDAKEKGQKIGRLAKIRGLQLSKRVKARAKKTVSKKITKAKRMIRSSDDNVELLKKLGELKKAGIISNKEFQTKKKQLLDKI